MCLNDPAIFQTLWLRSHRITIGRIQSLAIGCWMLCGVSLKVPYKLSPQLAQVADRVWSLMLLMLYIKINRRCIMKQRVSREFLEMKIIQIHPIIHDKCNLGTFVNRSIRDQFVSGNRSHDTQKKLLEEDQTFGQCVELAKSNEAANRESETLHKEHSETVHFVWKQKSKARKEKKPWGKNSAIRVFHPDRAITNFLIITEGTRRVTSVNAKDIYLQCVKEKSTSLMIKSKKRSNRIQSCYFFKRRRVTIYLLWSLPVARESSTSQIRRPEMFNVVRHRYI